MSLGREPGDLREEVTILEPTGRADDALGGRSGAGTYAPLGSDSLEYAEILPVSRMRRTESMKAGEPVEYEVTLRYRDDLTTRNRLRWDSNGAVVLLLVEGPVNRDAHTEYVSFSAREDR